MWQFRIMEGPKYVNIYEHSYERPVREATCQRQARTLLLSRDQCVSGASFAAASCTGTVPTPANPAPDAPVTVDCTLSKVVTQERRGLEPSEVCGEVVLVPLLN